MRPEASALELSNLATLFRVHALLAGCRHAVCAQRASFAMGSCVDPRRAAAGHGEARPVSPAARKKSRLPARRPPPPACHAELSRAAARLYPRRSLAPSAVRVRMIAAPITPSDFAAVAGFGVRCVVGRARASNCALPPVRRACCALPRARRRAMLRSAWHRPAVRAFRPRASVSPLPLSRATLAAPQRAVAARAARRRSRLWPATRAWARSRPWARASRGSPRVTLSSRARRAWVRCARGRVRRGSRPSPLPPVYIRSSRARPQVLGRRTSSLTRRAGRR